MDIAARNKQQVLFSNGEVRELLEKQLHTINKEIDDLPANAILNTNIDEFITYATAKYQLATPQLQEAEITVDQQEIQVDISGDPRRFAYVLNRGPVYVTGTRINYYVPFTGDAILFTHRPSTFNYGPPEGHISQQTLIISYDQAESGEEMTPQFQRDLGGIKSWLAWVDNDVRQYNQTLPGTVRTRFTTRREKLTKDHQLVQSLGYPVRRRPDAANTYTVPITKKTIPLPRPTPQQPEPAPLTHAIYEEIINIIQSMVLVMERSPDAFKNMKEEDLRTHFLVQLNGQYQGEGTAETFNTSGKTDILIRHQNKNLFIAECKFWNGPTSLTDAIGQLLGYTQWRDSKTAILLFNRNKNFTNVLQQIPGIVEHHQNFVRRDDNYKYETGYRCTMRQKDDPQRHFTMTVLAFDIPA